MIIFFLLENLAVKYELIQLRKIGQALEKNRAKNIW